MNRELPRKRSLCKPRKFQGFGEAKRFASKGYFGPFLEEHTGRRSRRYKGGSQQQLTAISLPFPISPGSHHLNVTGQYSIRLSDALVERIPFVALRIPIDTVREGRGWPCTHFEPNYWPWASRSAASAAGMACWSAVLTEASPCHAHWRAFVTDRSKSRQPMRDG